jgi:hypothetical protein
LTTFEQIRVPRQIRSGGLGGLLLQNSADPDVQIAHIRLFGPGLRYMMVAERMCGSGSGFHAGGPSVPAHDIPLDGSGGIAASAIPG